MKSENSCVARKFGRHLYKTGERIKLHNIMEKKLIAN